MTATRSHAGTWALIAAAIAMLGSPSPSSAQEAQKLFIEGDIVRGNTPNGITGPVCVLANQFKRKENVIFRIRVLNAMGQPLDDKALKSLTVELSDGQKIPASYRARPPRNIMASLGISEPLDYFWSSAWLIPENYPTGSLSYRVVATDNQGNTQTVDSIPRPAVAAVRAARHCRIYEVERARRRAGIVGRTNGALAPRRAHLQRRW